MMKLALMLAALVPLLLAGCSGGGGSAIEQDAQGRYVVEMGTGNKFSPSKFTVPANSTIVFENRGGNHDVQVTGPEGFSSGATAQLGDGEEFPITVTKPGRYEFACTAHHGQGMVGTFTVAANATG